MRRDEAIRRLKAIEPELRARGVGALYLFGSVARDEAGEGSDVDVFFDLAPQAGLGFDYFSMGEDVGALISAKVDIMTRESLHQLIRAEAELHAVRVF